MPTVYEVEKAVAAAAGVEVADLQVGGTRKQRFVHARWVFWKILRDDMGFGLVKIAERSGTDHTIVLHGLGEVKRILRDTQGPGTFTRRRLIDPILRSARESLRRGR